MTAFFARDLASSYAASVARVVSWLIVSAIVFRRGGADALALLMLLRGTVGLLSYAGLGIAPALVHRLTAARRVIPVVSETVELNYATGEARQARPEADRVFTTAFVLTGLIITLAFAIGMLYVWNVPALHGFGGGRAESARTVAGAFLIATLLRVFGDVFGANLQATGRLWLDNAALLAGEVVFVVASVLIQENISSAGGAAADAAMAYACGSAVVMLLRCLFNLDRTTFTTRQFDAALVIPLLAGGAWVLLSQLADWLYAPLNQLLIAHYLGLDQVAVYVPALQVDAALLLMTTGLTAVLLPHSARAAAEADPQALRRLFIQGILASIVLLTLAAVVVSFGGGHLFQAWFNDPLPATQAILPLVLVHTTIGSIGGVGRSVLFGMGRIKPYAIAAIVGGVGNAVLAALFLQWTDLGLRGVVLATVISVTLRCGLWMPWYVLRAIRAMPSVNAPLKG